VTATPPGSRWLAVVILPSLILLEREDITWLGDFERCMAAAMFHEADCSGNFLQVQLQLQTTLA